jgi:hypothetical protein
MPVDFGKEIDYEKDFNSRQQANNLKKLLGPYRISTDGYDN